MTQQTIGGLVLALGLTLAGAALSQPARAPAPLPPALSTLATDVSAVLVSGPEAKLLINETDHDVVSTRTVAIGEEYRDGWKVSAVSQASVTLTKGAESRSIALSGRNQIAAAAAPSGAAPVNVSASNSLVGGSPRTTAPRSPALQAAITAGDVKQILSLGGKAQDVAAALQAQGRLAPNTELGNASFVRIGDRIALSVASADGTRRQVISTPDFEGYNPPGPVPAMDGPAFAAGTSGTFVTNGNNVVVRQAITRDGGAVPPPPIPIPPPPR